MTVGDIRALIADLPDETKVLIDPGWAGVFEDAEHNGVMTVIADDSVGGDYVEYDEDEHGAVRPGEVIDALVIG